MVGTTCAQYGAFPRELLSEFTVGHAGGSPLLTGRHQNAVKLRESELRVVPRRNVLRPLVGQGHIFL